MKGDLPSGREEKIVTKQTECGDAGSSLRKHPLRNKT